MQAEARNTAIVTNPYSAYPPSHGAIKYAARIAIAKAEA